MLPVQNEKGYVIETDHDFLQVKGANRDFSPKVTTIHITVYKMFINFLGRAVDRAGDWS